MSKHSNYYYCTKCGHEEMKWLGKCPACLAWNTLEQQLQRTGVTKKRGAAISIHSDHRNSFSAEQSQVHYLTEIASFDHKRMCTGLAEVDRVLGGGIVPGSVVLIGGDPGIGKSTLMLQISSYLAQNNHSILYLTGEESLAQVKLRWNRLGLSHVKLLFAAVTDITEIEQIIAEHTPDVIIIDSIQSLYKPEIDAIPGSLSQVKECTLYLHDLAKYHNIACLMVGHVTKEGQIAGPKVLEHIVDTVIYFEGDEYHSYRMLRGIKNRFGPLEIGLFEMGEEGLGQITNPSELFLKERPEPLVGSTILPTREGTRVFLVEIQALVSTSHLGTPRRVVTGMDPQRVTMITAVLEKSTGLNLTGQDIYINVAGGVKVQEPAADLAVAIAVASSFKEASLPGDLVVVGEIGLTGEVRTCQQLSARLREADRMGFQRALMPSAKQSAMTQAAGELTPLPVKSLQEALAAIFNQ